jgi:FkbM family methyltransferase
MSFQNKIRGLGEIWQFDNRVWLAFTRIFFRRETLHVYRYKGLEILSDHAGGDANGAREVLLSPMYRRFLPKMDLTAPANVLDLGANNGGFSLLLLEQGVPLKKVVCVEFNPQTFARLHFNISRNMPCDAVPVNAALCGEIRAINIALGGGDTGDSIYSQNNDGTARQFTIEGRTLDDLCETYFGQESIDVCKMDVEGAEFEVFLGQSHSSISRCRYLIMEIHKVDGRRPEEIISVLEDLGLELQPTEPGADPTVYFFVNNKIDR